MEPKKCGRDGCAPLVQVRNKMGKGDYFDVRDFYDPDTGNEDFHESVELHDENKDDIRVICKKCKCTTGWAKPLEKTSTGKTVDMRNDIMAAWADSFIRFWKIRDAQKLLKEAGAWR